LIKRKKIRITLISLLVVALILPQMVFASSTEDIWQSQIQDLKSEANLHNKLSTMTPEEDLHTIYQKLDKMSPNLDSNTKDIKNLNRFNSFQDFRQSYRKDHGIQSQNVKAVDLQKVKDRGILLKVKDGESFDASSLGVKPANIYAKLEKENYRLISVHDEVDYHKKLAEIRKNSNVLTAEPNFLRNTTYVPADPQYEKQWYLDQIDMSEAWDINKGSSDVTIAVLDSGVNGDHPDLEGRVLPGYDFANNDSDPSDDNGHGTHIAGMIAANSDEIGMAGIDLNAKILPVKIMNEYGRGSVVDAVAGIYYAVDQGADVINMSYGTSQSSTIEEEALWEAYNQGIVLVAAAGNEASSQWSYPASYVPVIGVAATGEDDDITDFSNYGHWIDITAPGEDIYSTKYTGGYESGSGTSFSAPIITGLAGLLKAEHPQWTPYEIEWALESGADRRDGTEWNIYDGYGRANAYGALTSNLPSSQQDASNVRSGVEALEIDETTQEKIELPMDVDWFQFNVNESSTVSVDLENVPEQLDLVGILSKYDGEVLIDRQVIDNNGASEDEKLTIDADPGTYYFTVYDYYNHWSKDAYDINVSLGGGPVDYDTELTVEEEPNDTIDTANKLPFRSMGGGYFQTYEDYDVFEVDLPYSGDIVITSATDSYAYLNDPAAILADADGDIVDFSDVGAGDDGELKYTVETFENIKSGKYYVIMANLQGYSDLESPYIFDIGYSGDIIGEIPIPEASADSGTYYEPISVELTSQDDAEIKYTLDGTTPGKNNGTSYTDSIKMKDDTTLKAVAIKDGYVSNVASYTYSIEQITVNSPSADPPSGDYNQPIEVALSSNQQDVDIMYTVDRSTPDINRGTLYEKPISIDETTVVKAIAVNGRVTSSVSTFTYDYESKPKFPDVNRYETQIQFLAERGIIKGHQDGTFQPKDNVTRLQAVQMILNEMGIAVEKSNVPDPGFKDIQPGNYGFKAVAVASDLGFIKGKDNGTFDAYGSLTRGQMAAILVTAYDLKSTYPREFSDIPEGEWPYDVVSKLAANNITQGYSDNTFRPFTKMSREHFSVFLYNYLTL
jgi:subtilisin family serine protease